MLLFMEIAIAHQGHLVAMKIENPVEEVSIANLYKKDIANLQWTCQRRQYDRIPPTPDEWQHTISFRSEYDAFPFS